MYLMEEIFKERNRLSFRITFGGNILNKHNNRIL